MATTKQFPLRVDMTEGMDSTTRPHLVDQRKWRRSIDMRFREATVRQIPRKRFLHYVGRPSPFAVTNLVPVSQGDYGMIVAMTQDTIARYNGSNAVSIPNADGTFPDFATTTTDIVRWGTWVYNNRLFFVNPMNLVRSTDGAQITEYGTDSPAGTYVAVFYDHLVVGRPAYKGAEISSRVQWSHLYGFNNFTPDTHSEADHFDLVIRQESPSSMQGLTGMANLGGLLFLYAPTGIYAMRYVGLPAVMNVGDPVSHIGNGFKWGLAATEAGHFFIDDVSKSFYGFNGQSPAEIGMPIKDEFFSTLHSVYRQRTYAYVDKANTEVHWVYPSTAGVGKLDREVVFNYARNRWWLGFVEDVHAFCPPVRLGFACNDLEDVADALGGGADALGNAGAVTFRTYGGHNGQLYRDEVTSDNVTDLLTKEGPPCLEGRDEIYGDIVNEKEIDSTVIHSAYEEADGVEVYHAGRKHIDDDVSLVAQPQLWTPDLSEHRLSYPRVNARVHRMKFQPKATSNATVTTVIGALPSFELRAEIARQQTTPFASFSNFRAEIASISPPNQDETATWCGPSLADPLARNGDSAPGGGYYRVVDRPMRHSSGTRYPVVSTSTPPGGRDFLEWLGENTSPIEQTAPPAASPYFGTLQFYTVLETLVTADFAFHFPFKTLDRFAGFFWCDAPRGFDSWLSTYSTGDALTPPTSYPHDYQGVSADWNTAFPTLAANVGISDWHLQLVFISTD